MLASAAIFVAALSPALAAAAEAETMSWLDNGQIRLGVNLSIGGAITYLAESKTKVNMINSFDWGRQVQMSFYSGPVPFVPPGAQVRENWKGLGWNPIQSGDCFGHRSKVVEHSNDGNAIHVKCVPMQWPLNNVPGECTFESWIKLDGRAVKVTSRLNNARSDKTQYSARAQELPAVYTNGPWYKLVTYLGDKPFAGAPTTTVVDLDDGKGWPWRHYYCPENWSALVDKTGRGVGVYTPECCRMSGGFAGKKGAGGPKDGPTGYIAPNQHEILDHNIVYTYEYSLIVGTVAEIRDYVYKHAPKPAPPSWRFRDDRRHWSLARTTDAGWPVRGELRVNLSPDGGSALSSPLTFWQADKAPRLYVRAAMPPAVKSISVSFQPLAPQDVQDWPNWGNGPKPPPRTAVAPVNVPVTGDDRMRTIEIDLAADKQYRGPMTQLRLHLPAGKGVVRVEYVGFARPG